MSHRVASLRTGERAALLAAEEACALATALAIAPHDPTGVHEARKSLRRLRSLLALVRDALGKEAVDAIDDELRAMTRDLSALRDGQVVQDVARLLAREATDPGERENWQALLPALAGRHEQVLAAALCEDPCFMRRQAQAHRQAEHLRQLPWQRLKAGDLRHALARSERRQARAQAKAMASGQVGGRPARLATQVAPPAHAAVGLPQAAGGAAWQGRATATAVHQPTGRPVGRPAGPGPAASGAGGARTRARASETDRAAIARAHRITDPAAGVIAFTASSTAR